MAPWRRYALALAVLVAALALRLGIAPVEAGAPFVTFYPAVAIAVLLSGLGPGIMVLLLGGIAGHYLFLPPFFSFGLASGQTFVLATYYSLGLLTCLVVNQQHTARAAIKIALQRTETAKRELEEVLGSITDGFYALDSEWRFTYVNPRAEGMFCLKREDIIGRVVFDVFPLVKGGIIHGKFQQVITERTPLRFEAVSAIIKNWASFSVYPNASNGGISVYFRDISSEKAAHAELRAAKAEAERANRAKGKFLATASHDLRQPVQALVLFLGTLKARSAGTAMESPVHHMEQAVESLNTMLIALLDISRLDAGVLLPKVEAIDIGQLVGRISAGYEHQARQKGLRFGQHAPYMGALTDPTFLERILRNLMENALRYTETGGIVVGCRRRGAEVRIDVIDTGVGIAEENQRQIFEEYFQVNNDGRNRAKGLGLGLSIVSRLASLMGARIEVKSREGHGSRFSVFLPVAHTVAPSVPCGPIAMAGNGKRILVIEDEEMVRTSFRMMLESWGFDVDVADSEQAALDAAAAVPDAIIADYRLNLGQNGINAARRVHHLCGRAIPTVIVTGDTAPGRIREVHGSGFLMLHKPVSADQLKLTTAQLLRG
jgi:PAS domain S-box-containing protein